MADNGSDSGADFCAAARAAIASGNPDAVSDDELRRVLSMAVKLYAAKAENGDGPIDPFAANSVTATETVVAVCAMIRSTDLNLVDLAMWYGRGGH